MLESDPICDEIEVLNNNEINESNELFPEESVENEVFFKSFSLSPPQNINDTVVDTNISFPCAQSNKKSM